MLLFGDLKRITRFDEPMARHTSLRVGGAVRYFIEPHTQDDLRLVYRRCHNAGLPIRVLGRGCNVLVADGAHAWAVLSTRCLHGCRRVGNRIHADAGVDLRRLLALAETWGLGGLETLAGIPGSIGGAVAMNAGGHDGTIGDRLVSAFVAFPGEAPREIDARELRLGYRTSALLEGHPCLFSAVFELDAVPTARLRETRRDRLARKRDSQPLSACSAGCIFKNPPGACAGKLIDQASLKGTAVGDAVVSDKHANFILNRGRATATDVFTLIDIVRQRVAEVHGVWLELEIEVWRDAPGAPQAAAQRKEPQWASLPDPGSPSSTAALRPSARSR